MIVVKIPAIPATTYPILIQSGLLQRPDRWLPTKVPFEEIVIITDHIVKKIYGQALMKALQKSGYRVLLLAFRAGESAKNQRSKQILEEKMLRHGCGRHTLCLALGGGVVGDLAGFISATYMRGIPLVQIPTSLLAMVDSSVGGKTAIDTRYGKNLIGAFWQPTAVVADIHCLSTLPRKHRINGLIEAIKMALTSNQKNWQWIEKNLSRCLADDKKILLKLIQEAVKIKADIVAQDVKENGPRMILNCGHTIGHALEIVSGYKILHGYAVAYGILVEAKIAELLGFLPSANYAAILALFAKLEIYPQDFRHYDINKIIQATRRDKKNKSGEVRYILLKSIGSVYIDGHAYAHPVPDNIVKQALELIYDRK